MSVSWSGVDTILCKCCKSGIFVPPLSGCVYDVILSHVPLLISVKWQTWRGWWICFSPPEKVVVLCWLVQDTCTWSYSYGLPPRQRKNCPSTCLSEKYIMQDDIAMCTNNPYGRDQTDKKEIKVPFGEYMYIVSGG